MAAPQLGVFVSYAGEDREVAEAIARGLIEAGVPTFFDRFSLKVGDSVLGRIEEGLAISDHGVLIVSSAFLEKDWPRHETTRMVRDYIEGRRRLLPVWHDVSAADVRRRQPALEDIWATDTAVGLRQVVTDLIEAMLGVGTVAVAPLHEQPLHRFLQGEAELTLGGSAALCTRSGTHCWISRLSSSLSISRARPSPERHC